jgi:Tfp pilus assembly protein PilP
MSVLTLFLIVLPLLFSVGGYSKPINPKSMTVAESEEAENDLQDDPIVQQQQLKQFQEQQQQNISGGSSGYSITNKKGTAPLAPKAGPNTQSQITVFNSKDLEKKIATRVKHPFMLPNQLFLKIKKKLGDTQGEGYVDESVVPQKRWAVKYYKLVAIIWNVKKPKAMITDRVKNIHVFYMNDHIGNNEGIITAIRSGEVVIKEKEAEIKLKMQ